MSGASEPVVEAEQLDDLSRAVEDELAESCYPVAAVSFTRAAGREKNPAFLRYHSVVPSAPSDDLLRALRK